MRFKAVGVFLAFFSLVYSQDWSKIHPTGVRPLTPEEENRIKPKMFLITKPQGLFKAPLPASVKNTTYLPVVTSQGDLGSCAAYATCYYLKTYQEAKERGWIRPDPAVNPERIASPTWGYNIALRVPAYGDLAVSHYQVAEIICEYGIASWQEMPYDGNSQTYQWDAWPSEQVWRRAIEWRGQKFGTIYIHSAEGIEALKEHLAAGNVAVITTHVYSNFDAYPNGEYTDNEVLYGYTETGYRGGHALTVVGYDNGKQYYDRIAGQTKQGAFLCVNSWGQNWGVTEPTVGTRGFIWLPYDFFLQKKNGDPEALVIVDRINYKPEITATIGLNHTRGRKLIVRIYGAEKHYPGYPPDEVKWLREGMPVSNDYPLENSRIVVDLTDFLPFGTMAWYLEVFQLQMYSGTGQVTYFAVEKGDGAPIESADVPRSTVSNWYVWCKTGIFQAVSDPFGGIKVRRGGIAWADFNKDGKTDLLITGTDWKTGSAVASTLLFLNNGDGTFQPGITGNLPPLSNSLLAGADYDNDGYVDLVITGYLPQTGSYFTALYRNNGNNTFSEVFIGLPQQFLHQLSWVDYDNDGKYDLVVNTGEQLILFKNGGNSFDVYAQPIEISGTVSWADYDNDGWTDFIVVGRFRTAVYKNLGDGIFVESNTNFPGLRQASIGWGDYDNDGDLDLALSGRMEDDTAFLGIFRNNGDGTFSQIETQIIPVFAGSIVFADINNDGYADLVVTGRTRDEFSSNAYGYYPNRTTIYLNDTYGSFFNATAELPRVSVADFINAPVFNNTLAVVDYDLDGDLDIFLSGTSTYLYPTTPADIITSIYRNLIADSQCLAKPNTKPTSPDNLFTTPGWGNGSVILNWNAGRDTETPASGLFYNVRVGSISGGNDIVSPANRLVMPGFMPIKDRKLLLSALPAGTYYWAVQTVDNGLAVSDWSNENSFVIPAYTRQHHLHLSSNQPNYGTTNPAPGVYAYDAGTNVQITAIAYGGFTFSHWSGDIDTPQTNPASVLMDRPRRIIAHFKLLHDISPQWQLVINNLPWGATQWHSTVIFDNKIWIIGGYNGPYRSNAVYSSTDGVTWTTTTNNADWTKRFGHVSFVFNNRIWVLGGYDVSGYLNDVWSSADGITWTQHTSAAAWPKRYSFAGLVYGGKMWIFGGKGVSGWLNDVWSSSDGVNWTKVTASANWRGREGLAAVVFNSKMWIIGGYQGPVNYASDVWYSTDGITWTAATQSAAWNPRYQHSAVVHDNRIWITGGIVRDGEGNWLNTTNEVWYSWDGIYWSCFENRPWSARDGHTSFSFSNKLWILGSNDIWSAAVPGRPSGTLMLTIATNNNEAGTTIPVPGYYYDSAGKVFHLKALVNYGYQFSGWTGDVANPAAAETTTTLNSDKTVIANFLQKNTYQLTITVSPTGSGSTSPPSGGHSYPEGTVVDISAIPQPGYVFSHWTGGVSEPQSGSTTVLMNENKTVTANFIPDPFAQVVAIAGGQGHTVFLQDEGTVWTWGDNTYGQLGDGAQSNLFEPTASAVLESVSAVSAGLSHTAALKTNGMVWVWGDNRFGQIGVGSNLPVILTPSPVSNISGITAISCGGNHTLALKNNGTVWAWGRNDSYQLGLGDTYGTTNLIVPAQVVGPEGLGYLSGIIRVAAGYSHSLAISQDGSLWVWGDNSFGQLGIGHKTPSMYPVKVKTLSDIKGISAGGTGVLGNHSLAVKSDGTVWAWGANSKGQLGDGTNTEKTEPVQVKGSGGTGFLSNIRQVAAGGRHSLALDKDGTVWAWGDNTYGQLGNGTNEGSLYPIAVFGLPAIKAIACGQRHSLAIDEDGRVWVWGDNGCGQLGNGTQVSSNIPIRLSSVSKDSLSHILTVSVNPVGAGMTVPSGTKKYRDNTQVAITASATVRYQFSHWSGDTTGTETCIQILMNGNKNVVANFVLLPGIKCKLNMVCNPAGAGYLVPAEGEHEFDVGTVVNILVVPGYRYNFTNWSNQVTNPQAKETSVVLNGDTTVTAYFTKQDFSAFPDISAGSQHNLILREDSSVWANGLNNFGQLGIDSLINDAGNVQVKAVSGTGYLLGIIQVSAGGSHSTALGYDGTVYAWGRNTEGQLGDGTNTTRYRPVKVKSSDGTGELSGISYLSTGSAHTAAVKMDGTLWTWGNNSYGQLGINSTTPCNLPVQVHGEMNRGFLTKVKSVACGPDHTLALLEDGTVWAWGRNHQGQLGNGTTQDSLVPVRVSSLTNIIAIAASGYPPAPPFSLALKSDGTVWAWGGGRDGQLGNGQSGENYFSPTPVKVFGLTNIIAITAGDFHALALKEDGTVWAWGSNSQGQVGDDTWNNIRTTPVQVKGQDGAGFLTGVIKISAGYSYSMALKQDGTVWFWGLQQFNLFGSLFYSLPKYPTPVPAIISQINTSAQVVYLKMQIFPSGAGTTSPIESIHAYNPGALVNVRARANKDYVFSHWSEGETPLLTDNLITLDASKVVTAYFEPMFAQTGDINKDGSINILDVILCLRMSLQLPVILGYLTRNHPYTKENVNLADMNSDGEIDISDVVQVLRKSLGRETPSPDPYASRSVVPPETTPESVTVDVPAFQSGQVLLSDGTRVIVPAITTTYSVTLSRVTNYLDIEKELDLEPTEGLSPQTSGSLRTLQLLFDQIPSETEKLVVAPVVTIPRNEIGTLNPDTINILRVMEKVINGRVVRTYCLLPVHFDSSGNLVSRDIYLAGELVKGEVPAVTSKGLAPIYIGYVALTFQGTINWAREAKFVRMVPDGKAEAKRKPIDNLSDVEKEWELKKPIKNVIVLVHGHNEMEKTGLPGQFERNAEFPWAVDYKRDVWKYLYEVFLKEYKEFNSCTVFFEFIYPTWRPIFGHLDDLLVEKITSELEKQLSYNVEEKDSFAFNLFIVAHSMGGVVSRAAIVKFPEVLDDQFKHFISWGSPHRGAAMYSFRYLLTSPAYEAKTWKASAISTLMGAYVGRTIIDAPGIMDLRWTNGSPEDRRFLRFDDYFQVETAYQSQSHIYDLRAGSLLYNERLQQLNDVDDRGSKYSFLYGITTQGVSLARVDSMDALDVAGILYYGEIAIGATINRFLIENGANVLHSHLESDSDGAVPLVSMTGLGLNPSSLIDVGNIHHEAYYHERDEARLVAGKTLEKIGFKTNPEYDPPEIIFTSPADGDLLVAGEGGEITIEGKVEWKGSRKFDGEAVKAIKIFQYTYTDEFEHGFNWEGQEVTVSQENWSIDSTGAFSVTCNVSEPEQIYALRVVVIFKDDTEMHGVVMLGCPDEYKTTAQGETINWNLQGLGRIFPIDKETYVYEQPKAGETPGVDASATVIPIYRQDNSVYTLFAGKYAPTGGDPIDYVENEIPWGRGLQEPSGLNQMEIDFSTTYEDSNVFVIAYNVIDLGEDGGTPSFVKQVFAFLFPAAKHEKEELLPPYFRPEEVPPDPEE
ncbi:MAG: FG-GAP-like repeat-containing protein [Candidatus Omnitrophica bacterium]|nr:FG-GAP-like repeat-containing protein [Candidatus Omnitrophota bacterium]